MKVTITIKVETNDDQLIVEESIQQIAPVTVLKRMPWSRMLQEFFNVLVEQLTAE